MSTKSKNRAAKAQEQASLFDLGLEPIHLRIRRHVKENRSAGWREIAFQFGVSVDEVRRALQPEDKTPPGIPCCEGANCHNDGRFAIRPPGWEHLHDEPRYFCRAHLPEEHRS